MPDYEPITGGYAYTKEKKYSYIDPETGKIVYSETPPPGFIHTPRPYEAAGYKKLTPEESTAWDIREQQKLKSYERNLFWPETDTGIDAVPKQDYELGRLTVLRQYTDDMKIARAYKNADPLMYESFARDAETRKVLGLAELQTNLDKSKGAFRQIDDNLNLSPEEQFKIKTSYYQKNPVFQMPTAERTKRPEMPTVRTAEQTQALMQRIKEEADTYAPEEPQRTNFIRQRYHDLGLVLPTEEGRLTLAGLQSRIPPEKQELKKPPRGEWWEETKFRLKGGTLEQLKEWRRTGVKPAETGLTMPEPKTETEYNILPIGTTYKHPDGTIKVKK